MGKFILPVLFFLLTPITLLSSVALYSYHTHKGTNLALNLIDDRHIAYAALPGTTNVFEGSATLNDSRIDLLQNFLVTYHSKLAPFSSELVTKADKYGIDYRLLTAVAMQETTLCQKTLSSAPYNCWGFGIWGKKVTNFTSFSDAIEIISKYFGNKKSQGVSTLDSIGKIYNPGNTNSWKENVALFMSQI